MNPVPCLPTMIEQLLAPLHPNERELSSLFRTNIEEEMLREIAEADYGSSADESFAQLQEILRSGVASSNGFHLREVFELTGWGTHSGGVRASWIRLFTSTALLQLASRYPEVFDGECNTLAVFVSSAVDLGEPVARAAASVLAGRFLHYTGTDEDSVFLAFAILLLAAHVERRADHGPWLKRLCAWVEEEESRVRRLHQDYEDTSGSSNAEAGPFTQEWLLGLSPFRQYEGLWRYWSMRILLEPVSPHPLEADQALRRLGALFAEPHEETRPTLQIS